jgi:hypothetical protein
VIVPRRLPEAQTTAGTARVGKKFHLREAKWTRAVLGQLTQAFAAKWALGGKEEIN